MTIQRLTEALAGKIAAGEVIDRPVSVVKELVENAIDAKSERITIEIEDGGLRRMAVRDDGLGMSQEDLRICFERHATSKIRTEDDLVSIQTLGFRGEALASIAAVSKMEIVSRSEHDPDAHRIAVTGGAVDDMTIASRPRGTTVDVRDLFFNLPARAKFLGSPRTESLHINRTVQQLAILWPRIGWSLFHNGKETFSAPPVEALIDRMGQVYGADVARGMIPLRGQRGAIEIRGFISRPDLKRGNRRDQLFAVNGRLVNDRGLNYVLGSAYRGILRPGSFPIALIFIDLPSSRVDVNIHPRKEEIRISHAREVQDALAAALQQALSSPHVVGEILAGTADAHAVAENGAKPALRPTAEAGPARRLTLNLEEERSGVRRMREAEKVRVRSDRRVIGQLQETYLLVEGPDGLEIVDQHIAHERILYERLQREFEDAAISRQLFLLPARVELPFEDAAVLTEGLDQLAAVGVVLEAFGGGTFLLREYPQMLADEQTPRGFQELVEALVGALSEGHDVEKRLFDRILSEMACSAAIKAGERIGLQEAQSLVEQLMTLENPYACPHGRPIVFRLDREELDRKFRRR